MATKLIPISFCEMRHSDSDFKSIVKVMGYTDIILEGNPGIYSECNSYDTKLYKNLEEYWHQIMVYHGGFYRKAEFYRQFLKYFSNSMFNPVAHRNGKHVDQFLVRLSKNQIDTLFSNNLKLLMNDGRFIWLRIKINVAKAHLTHIDPLSKIKNIIKRQLGRCENISEFKVLNLNNFYERDSQMFISMANVPTFELICQCLIENPEVIKSIKGFKLMNNNIKSLKPLRVLQRISVGYLDLGSNDIDQLEDMYHLRPLQLSVLKIFNNPIKGMKLATEKIKEILPTLKSIDLPDQKLIEPTMPKPAGDCYETGDFVIAKYMKSIKWHQVIVLHKGRCAKPKILEALYMLCEDTEFYPCYYKENKQSDSFYVRKCLDTINAIKNSNLKLTIDDIVIPMYLMMNAKDHNPSEIDPDNAISEALNDRYNLIDKTLNLAAFPMERSASHIIINIANSKILTHILILAARKFGSSIQHMNLARNCIRSAKGLFPLLNMKSLTSLNLTDNKIEECDELFTLITNIKLNDLRLANNPFCKSVNCFFYVKEMKRKFPTLQTLDGYIINENSLTFNKNYLCQLEYYDFVQKFIKNYFLIFDSQMRYQIIEFYHIKAIYSMSMNYDVAKITIANSARINKHSAMAKNILKCSDFRQYASSLLIGNKIITNYFTNLPITEHDYNSFSIDVTYADENMICIMLSGILKELGNTLLENELWFGFKRTFVLKSQNKHTGFLKGGIDYTICNEHMHIFSLNIMQTKNGFKSKHPETEFSEVNSEATPVEIPREIDVKYENECLTNIFMEITKMKYNWSVRCLSRMDRKLLPAIEYFLQLEEFNKIPKIAYNQK